MGPTWDPSGADRTQVGPMLAPWILLSGTVSCDWCVGEPTKHTRGSWHDGVSGGAIIFRIISFYQFRRQRLSPPLDNTHPTCLSSQMLNVTKITPIPREFAVPKQQIFMRDKICKRQPCRVYITKWGIRKVKAINDTQYGIGIISSPMNLAILTNSLPVIETWIKKYMVSIPLGIIIRRFINSKGGVVQLTEAEWRIYASVK